MLVEWNRMQRSQQQTRRMLQMNMKLNIINQTYFKYFQQITQAMTGGAKEEPTSFSTSGSSTNILSKQEKEGKDKIFKEVSPQPVSNDSMTSEAFSAQQNSFLNFKRRRLIKENTSCPHVGARHYAKVLLSLSD
jgi:hypothetical protein